MKGITHFTVGVTLASCLPQAVQAGSDGNPLLFILGGIFGLLPDTLDFKILRFLHRHDVEIVPDPSRPDPALIAEALAGSIRRARITGRPVRVKLHSSAPGAGLWHRFRVTLPAAGNRVAVGYEGVVNTSQEMARHAPHPRAAAEADLPCAVTTDYTATTTVDILDGPSYAMEPLGDGRVAIRFIPWHRHWTHGLPVAAVIGGALGWWLGPAAGLIGGGAYALHALADQCGHMGSNLFFPFTRRRSPGLQWVRSGSTLANLGVVWIACLVIYWNLARAGQADRAPGLPGLLVLFGFLPLAAAAWCRRRLPR